MKLTERELDVLACVLIGEMSYQNVAEILKIHKSTVGTHVRKILVKSGCITPSELKEHIKVGELELRYKEIIELSVDPKKHNILLLVVIAFLILYVGIYASKMLIF